jgi:hypothetical protein
MKEIEKDLLSLSKIFNESLETLEAFITSRDATAAIGDFKGVCKHIKNTKEICEKILVCLKNLETTSEEDLKLKQEFEQKDKTGEPVT